MAVYTSTTHTSTANREDCLTPQMETGSPTQEGSVGSMANKLSSHPNTKDIMAQEETPTQGRRLGFHQG